MELKYKTTKYGTVPLRLYKYMDYAGACKTLKLGRLKYTPRHELNDVFEYTFSDDLNIDGKKLLKTAQYKNI